MKTGLEDRDHRHAGQHLPEDLHGRDVDRVVHWRDWQELAHGGQQVVVDEKRPAIARSADDGLEPDRVDGHVALALQVVAQHLDGCAMIGDRRRGLRHLARSTGGRDNRVGAADTLDLPAREHTLGRHVEELVLQRCGAEVGNEDIHRKWIPRGRERSERPERRSGGGGAPPH